MDNGAYETYRFMGLLLGEDERKKSEELINYCAGKIEEIEVITSKIPEDQKPRVYLASCCDPSLTATTNVYEPIDIAGGINVAEDVPATTVHGNCVVSKEQIVSWNPDIILIHSYSKDNNFVTVDEVLSDPTLQSVNAVKNKKVYNTKAYFAGWDPATGLCECYYLAKIFYPDLFKDLNVEGECNEILEKFYGVSGLYDWMLENCGDYVTWN